MTPINTKAEEKDKVKMPLYSYECVKCGNQQEQLRSDKDRHALDKIDPKFKCEACGLLKVMKRIVSSGIQAVDHNKIRLNGDPKKEAEYEKRTKDPERARRNRKAKFGHEGISITQSPYYKKDKRIKAQGKSDVSKKDFIQAAARNPNAMNAALKITKKSG
jgi:putative FmdB family regulatory protein